MPGGNATTTLKLRPISLSDIDRRTRAFQAADRLRAALLSDLGGEAQVAAAEGELAQRAAVLGAMAEHIEAQWLRGDAIDLADYLAAANAQRRVLVTLGLERRARDITPPTLHEYLATKAAA